MLQMKHRISKENAAMLIKKLEDHNILEIIRKDFNPSASVDIDIKELLVMISNQNFVPIVDDRGVLMGIITRKSVISSMLNKFKDKI